MGDRRYSKNGEWAERDGDRWKVGLTSAAATELGDVTFVELPRIGRTVAAGEALCVLEAVKAAADFYSPLEGTVTEANRRLETEPGLVNTSPEGEAWIAVLEGVTEEGWNALLNAQAWKQWEAGR